MKNRLTIFSTPSIAATLTACSLSIALAIEPPPDESKPPAALLGKAGRAHLADLREPSAFLGVSTAELPSMVSDHLGLEVGTGVIIRSVHPDSPADKSGLSVNDIITKINGKTISDPEHFSRIISARKAGDKIAIDLIHKGNGGKVELILAERPVDLASGMPREPFLDAPPTRPDADRLRGLLEQNLGFFGQEGFDTTRFPRLGNSFRQMRERLGRKMSDPSEDISGFRQNSTIRLMDQEGSVEITTANGGTSAIVRDNNNAVIWEGPWATDEDKASAPKHIRDRIDRVDVGNGFKLRLDPFGD